MKKPSVILMGSKPGSALALITMLELEWDVMYVVVSSKLKHPWYKEKTLEKIAEENKISVLTQKEIPRVKKVDIIISYMYRHLVKPEVIELAKVAALNFHPGPLPEFAGWYFYNMAILENSDYYGCTCHYLDNNFDTGPLLKVSRFPMNAQEETAYTLERKTQADMIKLFYQFCILIENGSELPKEVQNKNKMRYLSKEEFQKLKKIPKNINEESIDRYARAFWYPPYQCAYIEYNGAKVEIVPEIAKEQIAEDSHQNDLQYLISELNMFKHSFNT